MGLNENVILASGNVLMIGLAMVVCDLLSSRFYMHEDKESWIRRSEKNGDGTFRGRRDVYIYKGVIHPFLDWLLSVIGNVLRVF